MEIVLRAVDRVLEPRATGIAGWAAFVLRLAAGIVFVVFGIGKFVEHASEVRSLDSYGLPFPDQFTYAIGVVELAGALLVLGLLTRPAALVLAGDMVGAIATAGRVEGGPIHLVLAPILLAAMLYLLWAGPGPRALDAALRCRLRDRRGRIAGDAAVANG